MFAGTCWEGLGDMALLEEVYHFECALRFQTPMSFSVSTLYLLLMDQM